jgi:PAS domain-containing protein
MKKLQRTLLLIEDDPEERAAIRRALEAEVSRDITARKRAEEALREQARLMALREDIRAAQGAAETLPALLQAATEALVKHLGVAFARIWTLIRHPGGGRDVLRPLPCRAASGGSGAHRRRRARLP